MKIKLKHCKQCGETKQFARSDYALCSTECLSAWRQAKTMSLDINPFEDKSIDTDTMDYIVGMIWGDGCLSKQGRDGGQDTINVTLTDKDLAEKIRLIIGPSRKLYVRRMKSLQHSDAYSALNKNPGFILELRNMGLTERKSKTKTVPAVYMEHKERSAAFIRGYFDANGSIYSSKIKGALYYAVKFTSGSEVFIRQIKDILDYYKIKAGRVYEDKRHHSFYLSISNHKSVMAFMDFIYSGSTIHMESKFQRFKEASQK